MNVKPYVSDEAKKSQVSRMFNRIAPWYDFLNHFLSLGIDHSWRKQAVELLGKGPFPAILDLATGTADLALTVHRHFPESQITGVDIAAGMLDLGRKKIKRSNLSHQIVLLEGDSENLRFADEQFDAVTVAFGVRNFENLDRGLAEACRVLRPDGRFLVLEFSRPTHWLFAFFFNGYFQYVLPLIGRFTSKDPGAYQYLYTSVQAFPSGEAFMAVLEKNGFRPIHCKTLTFGICTAYLATR